jgi:hypothetical protein
MTGDADYLLRVVVPDVSAYERFLRDALTRIESAAGIKSSFALKQVKYSTALPLGDRVATGTNAAREEPHDFTARRSARATDKTLAARGRRTRQRS